MYHYSQCAQKIYLSNSICKNHLSYKSYTKNVEQIYAHMLNKRQMLNKC